MPRKKEQDLTVKQVTDYLGGEFESNRKVYEEVRKIIEDSSLPLEKKEKKLFRYFDYLNSPLSHKTLFDAYAGLYQEAKKQGNKELTSRYESALSALALRGDIHDTIQRYREVPKNIRAATELFSGEIPKDTRSFMRIPEVSPGSNLLRGMSLHGVANSLLASKAKKASKTGDHMLAGDLYLAAGNPLEAAKEYIAFKEIVETSPTYLNALEQYQTEQEIQQIKTKRASKSDKSNESRETREKERKELRARLKKIREGLKSSDN